ncbi:P110/LppT family adhesin N-terminal domain [Mesomycoplasma hyopneumoniae]|uniref:P110/LppT family adhesin N-terminal domain n=1 Tax=Mesomycoplasma hyopneumoniae TaxID=2099 RepID=UPI003857A2C1
MKLAKLLKKPFWLITTIAGISLSLSAAVGIVVGINSYNKSYYSYLNENPSQLKTTKTTKISQQDFDKIVSNLKIRDNFKKISAKTALSAVKNDLYRYDLVRAFEFSSLETNNYQISFDLENAVVDQNSIKNVLVFAKSEKDQITYSKQIELKGFAQDDEAAGDLVKFQIDQRKSFVNLYKFDYSFSEFQRILSENYRQIRNANSFTRLANALISSKANLSLYNSLGQPVFLDENYRLEPVLNSKKELNLLEKNKKLYLELNLVEKENQKKINLTLEIRPLLTNQEFTSELKTLFESNLDQNLSLNLELKNALFHDRTSFSEYLYGSPQQRTKTDEVKQKAKELKDLFDFRSAKFWQDTKFGTFYVIIKPQLLDPAKISQEDKKKLLADKKIRFEVLTTLKRKALDQQDVLSDIPVLVDLSLDSNKYETALSQIFNSTKTTKEFKMQEYQDRAKLSTKEIKETIDKLANLATKVSNLSEPSDEVVRAVYLLNTGKYLFDDEIQQEKTNLKKIIEQARMKADNKNLAPKVPSPIQKPTTPATSSGTTKPSTGTEKKVSVSAFSDIISMKNQPEQTSKNGQVQTSSTSQSPKSSPSQNSGQSSIALEEKFGHTIWKLLNTSQIYNFENTQGQYTISIEDDKLVFDFKLVSKADRAIIYQGSKISLGGLINSDKSAYDEIKQFSPDLFLDSTIGEQADYKNKQKKDYTLKSLRDLMGNGFVYKPETKSNPQENVLKLELQTGSEQKNPLPGLRSGLIYIAFTVNNINKNDYKPHYLIRDKNDKGVFIQRYQDKTEPNAFEIRIDSYEPDDFRDKQFQAADTILDASGSIDPRSKKKIILRQNADYLLVVYKSKKDIVTELYSLPSAQDNNKEKIVKIKNRKSFPSQGYTVQGSLLYSLFSPNKIGDSQKPAQQPPAVSIKAIALFDKKSFTNDTEKMRLINNAFISNYIKQ